ncbi:MAG: hypothetical protein IJD52_03520 [Alphaproteobacteria bacterium]|nr:hypothetical protein [Alphaproteobacteria bacterium]
MKRISLIGILTALGSLTTGAMAQVVVPQLPISTIELCTAYESCSDATSTLEIPGCIEYEEHPACLRIKRTGVEELQLWGYHRSCKTCGDGFVKTAQRLSCTSVSSSFLSGATYNICECANTEPCIITNAWETKYNGVQRRYTQTWDNHTTDSNGNGIYCECAKTYSDDYRCAENYYANGAGFGCYWIGNNNFCTGCSMCEPHQGNAASSPVGSDSASDCYISSSTTWNLEDGAGAYTSKFKSSCYYSGE